jgi:tRNA-2-methylthio-N6-dimethylallyladenosine synthase
MSREISRIGEGKKYLTLTWGCQMNERDSEIIAGILENAGYMPAPSMESADLLVFNTCSVRHSAENKVFGKLGEVKRLKRQNKNLIVALGGCMAQQSEVRKRLKSMGVDVVFGTYNLHELPRLLEEAADHSQRVYRVWDKPGLVLEGLPSKRKNELTGFVNIMYGCNNFCSYCIVPYVRGRERSRSPEAIVAEIEKMVNEGTREVTLLGQNVNSYGRGLEEKIDFADLLFRINRIKGLWRIRFTTCHPRDVNEKMVAAVRDLDKVCEHIHAPIQAGSDKLLKLMNRGYTREYYFQLSDRIREAIPGVAITSDLIVGFPGEEEQDFEQTLAVVNRVRFDAAFTFLYSPRSGTPASEMENQVSTGVKHERLLRLNEIQYGIALEENKRLEGKKLEVLVEGPSKTNPDRLTGRTRTNRIVIFEGPHSLIGKLVEVEIIEANTFTLIGRIRQENGDRTKNQK